MYVGPPIACSVTVPAIVMRPTRAGMSYQTYPSRPRPSRTASAPLLRYVATTVPLVDIRMMSGVPPKATYQRLPSGPVMMDSGEPLLGTVHVVNVPEGVSAPTMFGW